MTEATLFERLGGEAAIEMVVDIFYNKILVDSRICHFFGNIDINLQKSKQKSFLIYAFGGNLNYAGRPLRDSHRNLINNKGLNDLHFDAVAENLQSTLRELGIEEILIEEVLANLEKTRNDVLDRG